MTMSFWEVPSVLFKLLATSANYIMSATSVPPVDAQQKVPLAIDEKWENGKDLLGSLYPTKEAGQTWMEHLDGKTLLRHLSVPGTHDTAAFNFKEQFAKGKELIAIDKKKAAFYNCQNLPIFQQLDAGIRALDLRYGIDKGGKLRIWHAMALLDKKAEVLDIILGLCFWLRLHPGETIFVSLKVDNETEGKAKDHKVQEAIAKVLTETKEHWVVNLSIDTTLDEARGKLVLLRRFPYGLLTKPFGVDPLGYDLSLGWESNSDFFKISLNERTGGGTAFIEDFYLLENRSTMAGDQIELKQTVTIAHLKEAQANILKGPNKEDRNEPEDKKDKKDKKGKTLYITFTSAVGEYHRNKDEDVTPRVMALGRPDNQGTLIEGVNQHVLDWVDKQKMDSPLGIVFMDFVDLVREPSVPSNDKRDIIASIYQRQVAMTT